MSGSAPRPPWERGGGIAPFRGKRPNPKGGPRGARGGDPDVRRGPWPSGRPCAIWNAIEVELFLKLLEVLRDLRRHAKSKLKNQKRSFERAPLPKFARGKAPPLSDSRLRRPPEVGPPVNPRPSRQERPLAPQAGRPRESELSEGKGRISRGCPGGARGGDPDVRRGPWPGGRPCATWNHEAMLRFLDPQNSKNPT